MYRIYREGNKVANENDFLVTGAAGGASTTSSDKPNHHLITQQKQQRSSSSSSSSSSLSFLLSRKKNLHSVVQLIFYEKTSTSFYRVASCERKFD